MAKTTKQETHPAADSKMISIRQVSNISRAERASAGEPTAPAGVGGALVMPIPVGVVTDVGSSSAAAQSLHSLQVNFRAIEAELLAKPADQITRQDARRIQRAEVGCWLSRDSKLTVLGTSLRPPTASGLDFISLPSARKRERTIKDEGKEQQEKEIA